MASRIFIGELIEHRLREQNCSVAAFAHALGIQRPNAYRIFQLHSIDTDLLLRISEFLDHDFFLDYSSLLPNAHTDQTVSR